MDHQHNEFPQSFIEINESIQQSIRTMSKWGKILSIVGFVMLGLMCIGTIFSGVGAFALSFDSDNMGTSIIELVGIVIVYIIVIGLYFIPTYFLYRFSDKMKIGALQSEYEYSFQNLANFFKALGIGFFSVIGLYIIAIVVFAILFIGEFS